MTVFITWFIGRQMSVGDLEIASVPSAVSGDYVLCRKKELMTVFNSSHTKGMNLCKYGLAPFLKLNLTTCHNPLNQIPCKRVRDLADMAVHIMGLNNHCCCKSKLLSRAWLKQAAP